jgi:hypothetical protein
LHGINKYNTFWLERAAPATLLYGIFEESAKSLRWLTVVVPVRLPDWLVPEPEWQLEEGVE